MKLSAGKLAPSAVVVAAVAYGSWPYVEAPSPTPRAPGKEKSSAFDPSLLSPDFGEAPRRDPFHGPDAGKAEVASRSEPGAKSARDTKGARDRAPASEAEPPPPPDPRQGLGLEATLVRGRRRLAVINGRVYRAGEAIRGTGPEVGPVVLADVLPRRVVLENEGRRFVLALAAAPAAKPGGPAVAAGPPGAIAGGSGGIGP